jgi:uracil-DNA glycosylase family 4
MPHDFYLDIEPTELDARPGRGPIVADYAFVGIAPSTRRPHGRANEPFGAASHHFLQAIIGEAPGNIYVTNYVKTPLAPTKKPGVRLLRRYRPGLLSELKIALGSTLRDDDDELPAPKRVLALGSVVAEALCPGFKELREDHGTLFYNPELNCYVVPTYHFSAVARDPTKREILARDLFRFFNLPDPKPFPAKFIKSIPRFKSDDVIYLDIETDGLEFFGTKVTAIGIYVEGADETLQLWEPTELHLKQLQKELARSRPLVIGHNLPFDLGMLTNNSGAAWRGFPVVDTMLVAHIIGEKVKSLKHLTTMYTDRPGSRAFGGITDPGYLSEDLLSTMELYHLWKDEIEERAILPILNDLVPRIVEMRWRGVPLDLELLEKLEVEFTEQVTRLQAELNLEAGYDLNWNSGDQVISFLLEQGVKLTEKTPSGKFTVKEQVMLTLAEKYPICQKIMDFRAAEKRLSFIHSYKEFSQHTGKLHPNTKLTGTETGRLSQSDPNLQQVERVGPLKLLFVPSVRKPIRLVDGSLKSGSWGLIDLARAELCLACLLSDDDAFAEALMSEDVHRTIASWVYHLDADEVSAAQRKRSKGITFGLLYGGSAKGLAQRVGMDESDVENVMEIFFKRMPKLMRWLEKTGQSGIKNLFIETPMGRHRSLRELMIFEGPKSVKRKAVNTPTQGTASDAMLVILNETFRVLEEENAKTRPLFGVHDSTMLDIYPGEEELSVYAVQEGFKSLRDTPLGKFRLFETLPIEGEVVIGKHWAAVESTSDYYDPENNLVYPVSSLAKSLSKPTRIRRLHEVDTEPTDWENPEPAYEEAPDDWGEEL